VDPGGGVVLLAQEHVVLEGFAGEVDHALAAAIRQVVVQGVFAGVQGDQADAAFLGAFAEGSADQGLARVEVALGKTPLPVAAPAQEEPGPGAALAAAEEDAGGEGVDRRGHAGTVSPIAAQARAAWSPSGTRRPLARARAWARTRKRPSRPARQRRSAAAAMAARKAGLGSGERRLSAEMRKVTP